MIMFADICLSLSLLAYLAGLIVLVPEPVSRLTCARDSLKVASVLFVSLIWMLLAIAMAIALSGTQLDWMGGRPDHLRALIPLILIPLGIVTTASGSFFHLQPEEVPSCFRMWTGWAIIVIPALLISLAGAMLHANANMRTLMGMLSGAISILATASTLCALRYALLHRRGKSCSELNGTHLAVHNPQTAQPAHHFTSHQTEVLQHFEESAQTAPKIVSAVET